MRFNFYVVFERTKNGKAKQRITTRPPSLFNGEVAVKMIVDVPDDHFRMIITPPIKIFLDPPSSEEVKIDIQEIKAKP